MAALWTAWPRAGETMPTFEQLTFRRGGVDAARFAPDGSTVLYSGAFEQEGATVYSVRMGRSESRSLEVAGVLQAVSASGEVFITIGSAVLSGNRRVPGTLARVPIEGGSPRELQQGVSWAEWSPDGERFALVRNLDDSRMQVEWPAGHVVSTNAGPIAYPRVSPSGERLAFFQFNGLTNRGALVLIGRDGARSDTGRRVGMAARAGMGHRVRYALVRGQRWTGRDGHSHHERHRTRSDRLPHPGLRHAARSRSRRPPAVVT